MLLCSGQHPELVFCGQIQLQPPGSQKPSKPSLQPTPELPMLSPGAQSGSSPNACSLQSDCSARVLPPRLVGLIRSMVGVRMRDKDSVCSVGICWAAGDRQYGAWKSCLGSNLAQQRPHASSPTSPWQWTLPVQEQVPLFFIEAWDTQLWSTAGAVLKVAIFTTLIK